MGDLSPFFENIFSPFLFLSLVISLALVPLMRRAAIKINLIDHPGGRKQHHAPVPLVGGTVIVVSSGISIYVWGLPVGFEGFAFAAMGLFLVGFLDDKYDISAKFRLLAQTLIVSSALYFDNTSISTISFTDEFSIGLGVFSYPFTVILILALINAVNMLDGLDGLSSGVVLIILGFLIGLSSATGNYNISFLSSCIFGGVFGFWAFNYRFSWREKASVFMGDSGTIMLGFVIPYLAIKLNIAAPSQTPNSILLWLFAIPIWDICAVVIKRLRDGISPLQAGRDHIHHVLLKTGLTVRHTLHLIYLLTVATISFGIVTQFFGFSQIESFATFFIFMAIYLDRVGSLASKKKAEVYNFEVLGDRRTRLSENENEVIDIKSRSKTLS